jgi:hypothetical protein
MRKRLNEGPCWRAIGDPASTYIDAALCRSGHDDHAQHLPVQRWEPLLGPNQSSLTCGSASVVGVT